jgi:hypothetical protein
LNTEVFKDFFFYLAPFLVLLKAEFRLFIFPIWTPFTLEINGEFEILAREFANIVNMKSN